MFLAVPGLIKKIRFLKSGFLGPARRRRLVLRGRARQGHVFPPVQGSAQTGI